jgi:acyl carrier protein
MAGSENLWSFVAERFLLDPAAAYAPATALFSTRIIDSFGVMELILKIEDLYGVRLDIPALVDHKIDTFADLVTLVDHVRTGAQP